MGGRLLATLRLSPGYHMPYVGLVHNLSSMMAGTSGVAFPVPRNRATIGRATVLANSSEKKKSFITSLMGIRAKNTSNQRMIFSIVMNRLTSLACRASKEVGNTLVQNFSSLPKDTYSGVELELHQNG